MNAPSLFDPPPVARASDPPASQLAGRANAAERAAQSRAILMALAVRGRAGATNDDLDAVYGWRPGTASRRTAEMVITEEHPDRPIRRLDAMRPTRTGSPAHVLVLAKAVAA